MIEMEDPSLKEQFERLQEQQRQKLMRRKQKKETEKEKPGTARSAFGITDELNLKLADPPATSGFLSEELVDHLNDQLRELKDENGRLYKLLSERDFEIRNLKKKKVEENSAVAGVTNETAAIKIVELSKKVRELTAELESERTRCKQLQKKCQDAQRQVTQLNSMQTDTHSVMGSMISLQSQFLEEKTDEGVDVKGLQDKLKQTESKLADYRNQCQALKQELKIQHKVLQQEVGENVNVQSLLNSNSGWRGRAQQVLTLQNKIEDLKTQLDSARGRSGKDGSLEDQMLGRTSARRRTQDEKYKEELRKVEKDRKEAQERAASELKALEEDHSALKNKMDACKARNKVLSNETKSLKQQIQTLLEKGKNDDELVQALMRQLQQLKQMLETSNQHQQSNMERHQEKMKDMSVKVQQDNNIVEQLKAIVAEKEQKVKVLENEIHQMKLNHIQRAQMESVSAMFQEPRPPSGPVSSRPGTVASEGGDTIVLTTVTPPESRLSERPPTSNRVVESARALSRVSARPASASNVSGNNSGVGMADLQYQCQEYLTMMQVSDVEREKLAELVHVLQKRIDETSSKMNDMQSELIQERKKNVVLEKKLGKAKLDPALSSRTSANVKTGRLQTAKTSASTARESVTQLDNMDKLDQTELEELIISLDIQRDENEALKAALQSTLKAKEEDLKLYSDTMDETKKVFLQALRQFKHNANTSS
ncbi:coiled-coil domain-containing protein 13-like [Haliotis cracherodii]|uniref:coiled-coil domain-containing protein 13-like n=1 Tax=Haliotis cracherodii TaxID=6455 RepID=UPI0039EACAE2